MPNRLNAEDRMRLMHLLCAVAWVDGEVHDAERALVMHLTTSLGLSPAEIAQVGGWLAKAPDDGVISLEGVPAEHRQLFFQQALDMVAADGELKPEELDRVSKMLSVVSGTG